MSTGPQVAVLRSDSVSVARVRSDRVAKTESVAIPNSDSFSTIVQLRPFKDHRLWRNGRLVHDGSHSQGALSITHLVEDWRCEHRSAFDNIRFTIDRGALRDFLLDNGKVDLPRLKCESGQVDSVVYHLGQALLPALADPDNADNLYVDHVLLAFQAYLVGRYGGVDLAPARQHGLSRHQLAAATAYLAEHASRKISMTEVASICDLSTSHFIRTFKKSTGRTPHRWLTERRIQMAQNLLLSETPIAEIAVSCGFTDQSHLTHVFSSICGASPAAWRRMQRK
ncbi:helix-turn-helix domain-containing protein [Sinorhizobium mexicanum]|uniref:Helix-turn-helix transcriptional regulator n=1 Tax=Sinorhizobium mexicanum TaxID=375549 RepID=A0A859QR89_9HYPH|nr:AraC family transcriptional regulator [Sinorhizobium mexicanum]MBP1886148.1 AraC-like DNA-binding protein [Sinorhizobium mexicanum]QLL65240.1 helix-turn-helix transcriptional regulator [Sinorhizobium mexicanum]